MNELEYLKKLIELENKSDNLKLDIQEEKNDEDKRNDFIAKLEIVNQEIEKTKKELVGVKDKSFSSKAKTGMIQILGDYIIHINLNKSGVNLSRDQGLMTRNELFKGIVRELNRFTTEFVTSRSIPSQLKYTRDKSDSIQISDLTEFLNSELNTLRLINSPNYLELREFEQGFSDRIYNRFDS